jgi:hypothetical protein
LTRPVVPPDGSFVFADASSDFEPERFRDMVFSSHGVFERTMSSNSVHRAGFVGAQRSRAASHTRAIVAGELRGAAMPCCGLTVNKPDNPVFARVFAVT